MATNKKARLLCLKSKGKKDSWLNKKQRWRARNRWKTTNTWREIKALKMRQSNFTKVVKGCGQRDDDQRSTEECESHIKGTTGTDFTFLKTGARCTKEHASEGQFHCKLRTTGHDNKWQSEAWKKWTTVPDESEWKSKRGLERRKGKESETLPLRQRAERIERQTKPHAAPTQQNKEKRCIMGVWALRHHWRHAGWTHNGTYRRIKTHKQHQPSWDKTCNSALNYIQNMSIQKYMKKKIYYKALITYKHAVSAVCHKLSELKHNIDFKTGKPDW